MILFLFFDPERRLVFDLKFYPAPCVSAEWIRIQYDQLIQVRTRIENPDPDPGGQIRSPPPPPKKRKK
jgi:hypothetical protein